MRKVILMMLSLFVVSLLAEEKAIKLGPFQMIPVKEKEKKVKIENVVIKKIEGDVIYLEDGEIKMETSVSDIMLSNPHFLVDLSGNPRKINEIKFPALVDIEAVVKIGPSELPYRNVRKVLKIIYKGESRSVQEKEK